MWLYKQRKQTRLNRVETSNWSHVALALKVKLISTVQGYECSQFCGEVLVIQAEQDWMVGG